MSPTDPTASGRGPSPQGRPAASGSAAKTPPPSSSQQPPAKQPSSQQPSSQQPSSQQPSSQQPPAKQPAKQAPSGASPAKQQPLNGKRPAAASTPPTAPPAKRPAPQNRPAGPPPGATAPMAAVPGSAAATRPGQAPANRPSGQPAVRQDAPAARPQPGPGSGGARPGGPRKVRLNVARLDPWSVLKLSFLLSVGLGISTVVASFVVWQVLNGMGVFTDVNGLVRDILGTSAESFNLYDYIGRNRVLSLATVISVANVVLLTALSTLGAFLYNLASGLVGGLHVTLSDD